MLQIDSFAKKTEILTHQSVAFQVHGIACHSSCFNTGHIDHLHRDHHHAGDKLLGDLCNATDLIVIISKAKLDKSANLVP